jgi:hypothetical protein
MSFEEKVTWVGAAVSVIVAAAYFAIVGSRLDGTPVAEVAYKWPMIIAAAAMLALNIVGNIVMAVGTAISVEITGKGSIKDLDRKDERDVHIGWRGDRAAYYVSCVLMLGVLVITMLGAERFWIANGIFASFLVAGLVASAVKLVAYRRGF